MRQLSSVTDQFEQERRGDQKDDHPLQYLHTAVAGLIGDFFVDAFEGLKLAQDAGVPFAKVKPAVDQSVDPREILVAEQFQGIVYAFEKERVVYLKLGHAAQIRAVVSKDP